MPNSFWMISKDDHIIDLKYSFYGIPILQKDISLIIAIFLKKTFLDMTCLLLLETVTLPEEDRAAASGPQKLTKGFKRPKRGCLNWNPNAMSNEICQETLLLFVVFLARSSNQKLVCFLPALCISAKPQQAKSFMCETEREREYTLQK